MPAPMPKCDSNAAIPSPAARPAIGPSQLRLVCAAGAGAAVGAGVGAGAACCAGVAGARCYGLPLHADRLAATDTGGFRIANVQAQGGDGDKESDEKFFIGFLLRI